jgi:DNA-directed RNA polymerase subunit omega
MGDRTIALSLQVDLDQSRLMENVMSAHMDGITNPPIDELLDKAGSKYSLVLYAARRARQINAYYSQLGEGLLEYVGPLVDTHVHEKPLSIALREINEGLLSIENLEPTA